jgi:hypothetical protein
MHKYCVNLHGFGGFSGFLAACKSTKANKKAAHLGGGGLLVRAGAGLLQGALGSLKVVVLDFLFVAVHLAV